MVKALNKKPNFLERRRSEMYPGKGNIANGTGEKPKDQTGLNKGYFGGACNRSACLKPGADWYNHGSLKYYCQECALWLSEDAVNKRESIIDWGHDLCTPGEYDQEHYRIEHEHHKRRLGNVLTRYKHLDLKLLGTRRIELLLEQEKAFEKVAVDTREKPLTYDVWNDLVNETAKLTTQQREFMESLREAAFSEYLAGCASRTGAVNT